ncbi:MAG: inositol monophosphatase family protein, partial [Planctomycetia bacterium]|nr:inositol monophosphatase family protein [Planctomycetia bacterium]
MSIDYRPFMEECERIVRRTGSLIREKAGHVRIFEKGPSDLVTEADLAAQKLVRELLAQSHPDHLLIGEEDTPQWRAAHDPRQVPFAWIVDPIDGTTNYAHNVPFYCVSLAMAHQ